MIGAPFLEHADEPAFGKVLLDLAFEQIGKACACQRGVRLASLGTHDTPNALVHPRYRLADVAHVVDMKVDEIPECRQTGDA